MRADFGNKLTTVGRTAPFRMQTPFGPAGEGAFLYSSIVNPAASRGMYGSKLENACPQRTTNERRKSERFAKAANGVERTGGQNFALGLVIMRSPVRGVSR